MIEIGLGKMKKIVTLLMCLMICFMMLGNTAQAETLYESDGIEYDEGYIVIGESHIVLAAHAFAQIADENGNITGLKDIKYHFRSDKSLSETEQGMDNTFIMGGNLFFVFEGNRQTDGETQYHKHYIYSNGKDIRGIGVEKIHQIIDTNPNVQHWNIISFHGAVASVEGIAAGRAYARSYRNWMKYEFPEASFYFMSHSTMTKYYKGSQKNAEEFDTILSKRMGERWIDCSEFFNERYPQGMLNPDQKPDTIHWSYDTYVELFTNVISQIQKAKGGKVCLAK